MNDKYTCHVPSPAGSFILTPISSNINLPDIGSHMELPDLDEPVKTEQNGTFHKKKINREKTDGKLDQGSIMVAKKQSFEIKGMSSSG